MPAKGRRGAKKVTAVKTQENVVDSTTNQKSEEKVENTTADAEQNNVDKKSVGAKRKQTKEDATQNGNVEVPSVPVKRGRGRPPAAVKTSKQPASVSLAKKQEEQELPPEKQQTKGKRGAKKGATSAAIKSTVTEVGAKEEDEFKKEESEIETRSASELSSSHSDSKPTRGKKDLKKVSASTETENGEQDMEPQKNIKGGKRRAVAAVKTDKSATNGDIEEAVEPAKKGRGVKAKKELGNGVVDGKNPAKTVGNKKATVGGGKG